MRSTLDALYDILQKRWEVVSRNNLYMPVSIEKLKTQLEVSALTVRKNLHLLESQGKITLEVHSGSFWIVTLVD